MCLSENVFNQLPKLRFFPLPLADRVLLRSNRLRPDSHQGTHSADLTHTREYIVNIQAGPD